MLFAILLLFGIIFVGFKLSPREKKEHAHVHGAGQIGLAAALALFGVDYFTSFYYATGEMMSALHPYGLQNFGYIAVAVIAVANAVFGALYMYSLGIFNEGGGSYTASMRYLWPTLSLIVAVVLIQDYVFTIVVSSLSGVDQLLSILNAYGIDWIWHFLIGVCLVAVTYYLTIRGRGESAKIVFTLLAIFIMLSVVMTIGLIGAHTAGVPAVVATETPKAASLSQAFYHMLTASMKGMVALSGLEAMSNGIQFVINDDSDLVKWGKKHLPRWKGIWSFYSGKSGIGRIVQTSFLFYGGLTTLILATFAIRFNVFDGTNGRTLVGNLASIGFGQIPGGDILYWAYQLLAVVLLAAASMTAFQDLQATAWRDVAIGEIPEIVVYRNKAGTFTRSVTAGFVVSLIVMFLVRGQTTQAVPFYGVGVFMPIMVMGLAVRQHVLKNFSGRKRFWGSLGATVAAVLSGVVFVGQIVGKWEEGGWVVLITFSLLAIAAHVLLLSPIGYRQPKQIYRIVRDKARVQGAMASIVEWQSLRMQEYRYSLRNRIFLFVARFFELFGVRRPVRFEPVPAPAGGYNDAVHADHPDAPSLLAQYMDTPVPTAPVADVPVDSGKPEPKP
jgi:amino acid transporter